MISSRRTAERLPRPTRAASLLEQLGDRDTHARRQARLTQASALESTGRINDAITLLEDLLELPPQDALWLRAAIALTRCYRESGDLARAVDVGGGRHVRSPVDVPGVARTAHGGGSPLRLPQPSCTALLSR